MSDIDKVVIGTRRRLLSSDFNDGERLRDRIDLELISAQQLGDAYKAIAAGVGGVLGGLEVRAVAGTNTVEVQPGIAFVAQTPADTLFDPPVNIIELRSPTIVDLTSFIDGANPRLVTIEIEATLVSKVNSPVDVFDETTGTFTIQPQDIVTGSTPTLSVRAGAAGPSPQVAAGPGTDGFIPLAVVKLSTAQANFSDNFIPVLLCRPLLSSGGKTVIAERTIQGAGISVGEENAGTFGALTGGEIHDTRLELSSIAARIRGTVAFTGTIFARTPDTTDPATLIASTGPVYCYAVPPPWANDYGAIAAREARVLNPNSVALTTPDSVVFGDGSTFTSLGLGTNGIVGPTFDNGFPIWDDQPPGGIENGPISSAPARVMDTRGPTSGSSTLDATQDPSWGNTQVASETVYLGAIAATGGQFVAQSYRGSGLVDVIDEVDIVAGTGARPIRLDAASVIATTFGPGEFPSMGQGGVEPDIMPTSASSAFVGVVFEGGAAFGNVSILIGGIFGSGGPDATGVGVFRQRLDNTTASYSQDDYLEIPLNTSNQGALATVMGGGSLTVIYLRGYRDALLASR